MSLLSFCKGVRGGGERVERSAAAAMTMDGHEDEARRSSETAPETRWRSSSEEEEEEVPGADAEEYDGPAPKAMPRPLCPECGTRCHDHGTSK